MGSMPSSGFLCESSSEDPRSGPSRSAGRSQYSSLIAAGAAASRPPGPPAGKKRARCGWPRLVLVPSEAFGRLQDEEAVQSRRRIIFVSDVEALERVAGRLLEEERKSLS